MPLIYQYLLRRRILKNSFITSHLKTLRLEIQDSNRGYTEEETLAEKVVILELTPVSNEMGLEFKKACGRLLLLG